MNARSLDVIADDINKLERGNIFDIGDLLLEAKAHREHGQWLSWLRAEFESYSVDTAERYIKVAKLSTRFRGVRNLKLAATTLYELADHENEDDLQAIIEELAKHATKKRLKPLEAERVIKVGIGRRRFGDWPDATLVQLFEFDGDEAWYEKAVAALQECKPETDEAAQQIADKIEREYWEILTEKEEETEPLLMALLQLCRRRQNHQNRNGSELAQPGQNRSRSRTPWRSYFDYPQSRLRDFSAAHSRPPTCARLASFCWL
jgi:hypothetical protein